MINCNDIIAKFKNRHFSQAKEDRRVCIDRVKQKMSSMFVMLLDILNIFIHIVFI